jgi:starch phosphorylase
MSEQASSSNQISPLFPLDIKGVEILVELALDLRWSWNHCTDDIWQQLDPALWARTQNPWIVLQTVSRERLRGALADPVFVKTLDDLVQSERRATEAPAWFHTAHTGSGLTRVAYFSMEFMLGGALPIYSGGLGNVAGDQLKSASDLGVPLVGVGLLYQQGYFRQVIDRDGAQQALFPISAGTPGMNLASRFTTCWPSAAGTRTMRRRISTWRIWRSAGAGTSMASVACTGR